VRVLEEHAAEEQLGMCLHQVDEDAATKGVEVVEAQDRNGMVLCEAVELGF
jgi:hypothetical protein